MPTLAASALTRRHRRKAIEKLARAERIYLLERDISTLQKNLCDALRESDALRARLEDQRSACACHARSMEGMRMRIAIAGRSTSPGLQNHFPVDIAASDSRKDRPPVSTPTSTAARFSALEVELELQRILLLESQRHADRMEESYTDIVTFKDVLLAEARAQCADLTAQLRLASRKSKRNEARADGSFPRAELYALEKELTEQHRLILRAIKHAARGNALGAENNALQDECRDLKEERDTLSVRVKTLEDACIEADEQRVLEGDVLEQLRDELASVIADIPPSSPLESSSSPGLRSPFFSLPDTSAYGLLDEELELPSLPCSPAYSDSVYTALSSPPPRYSRPVTAPHSRSVSLDEAVSALQLFSPNSGASTVDTLPPDDSAIIEALETELDVPLSGQQEEDNG